MSCPTTGNYSFPIQLGFTPTSSTYGDSADVYTIEIDLASQVTPPSIGSVDKCLLNQNTSTPSKAQFNGHSYSLKSIQITPPSHTSWIVSSDARSANVADMLLTFTADDPSASIQHIFSVIPFLASTSIRKETDPAYLRALGSADVAGPYTLQDCLPSAQSFAAYTTCLNPNSVKAVTLVFYQGKKVSADTLNKILMADDQGGPVFGTQVDTRDSLTQKALSHCMMNSIPVIMPEGITVSGNKTVMNSDNFAQRVRVSKLGAATGQRVDNTSAYKCVPLDPDRDVKDGKIYINTATGEVQPMNEILAARQAIRTSATANHGLDPGVLEQYIAIFLAVLLACLFLGGLGILFLTWTGNISLWLALPLWVQQTPMLVLVSILFGFIGFLVGSFIRGS